MNMNPESSEPDCSKHNFKLSKETSEVNRNADFIRRSPYANAHRYIGFDHLGPRLVASQSNS
ncbi:hypothetical protein MITS9509_03493 [Synechococcus sp. MIT S9509]|nr:hypothetical protein MITS9509_03493 [Synechococcus sp. MIT S9509]